MEKFGKLLRSVEIGAPSLISIQKIRDSLREYGNAASPTSHFRFNGVPEFSFLWWYFDVLNETFDFEGKKFINLFEINEIQKTSVKDCRDFLKLCNLQCGGLAPLFSLFEREERKELAEFDDWILSPTDRVCYGNKYSISAAPDIMKRSVDEDEIPPYKAPHSTKEEVIAGFDLLGGPFGPCFNIGFLSPILKPWNGPFYLAGISNEKL